MNQEAKRLVQLELATASGSQPTVNDSNEFIESIVDVIAELPKSGFGKDGKPNVKALQNILEFEVSASQRDDPTIAFDGLQITTSIGSRRQSQQTSPNACI